MASLTLGKLAYPTAHDGLPHDPSYRAIFEAVGVGMARLSLQGRLLEVNQRFADITGRTRASLIGLHAHDITHPEDITTDQAHVEALLDGRQDRYALEKRYLRPDGVTVWAVLNVVLLRDANQQPVQLIAVIEDISERLRMQEAMSSARAAERASKAKTEFLSRMSHELRTPLNAILGFAQLLSMGSGGELSPSQSRQMGLITTAGRQLLALIEDVLDLSKVESGEVGLNLHAVDIDPVLETCMEMLSPMCTQAGVSVNLQRASPLPLVQADPQRLLQIFMNLASNACKYNRPGGTLDIQLRQEGEDVVIHFIDSGQGVPPGELSELFQPFRRSHVHNHIEGSGLGLYIVKQLVDRMGGRITAESTWGEGSRFSVHLPAMAALQHPSAQAA